MYVQACASLLAICIAKNDLWKIKVIQEFYQQIKGELARAEQEGLFKRERQIVSEQQAKIVLADGSRLLNFCANNYLGLANHPALIAAAKTGMDTHGFGMASVCFICGTQDSHRQLEQLAAFLGMEDAILYSSCYDANGGLFETLLSEQDAVISDALNHASIIDGIGLCQSAALPLCQQRYGGAGSAPAAGDQSAP